MLDRLLPSEDEEISEELQQAFRRQGISYLTGANLSRLDKGDKGMQATVEVGDQEETVRAEKALIGIGMEASTDGLGLEENGRTDAGWLHRH